MDDEQQIRDLIRSWLDASKAGDTAKVLELMAEDVVFLIAGQAPMRGRQAFAASQQGLRDFELDADSHVDEIRVMGDWAWSCTTLTVTITPRAGGKSMKRSGNTLSILKKQDGRWTIFRDANMLAPVPENGAQS